MINFLKKYPYVLLVLIAVVGYYQVALFQNTLKWDVTDQYYPWRMFVVQCLRNGILPFWNPYEQFGYPMHADPQSGVWYPVVWLMSLFGPYTLYSVQLEFLLHVIGGGVGMLFLLQRFHVNPFIALINAIAYMFCGLFVGNAQHLTFTIAACWLPFVILAFKNMAEHNHWRFALHFALFGYLLVSGGYPAFAIILFYILLTVTVFLFIRNRQSKHWMKRFLLHSIFAVVLLLLCSSGILYSVFQSSDYLARATGLSFKVASFGPFSPQSLISLMFPLASARDSEFFGTDISMSSVFIGMLPLAGFMLFIIRPKSRSAWLILAATIVMLFASFGSYTPVFGWLYKTFPMLDLFRFPSVYRLFFITGILLLSGIALSAPDAFSRLKLPLVTLGCIAAVVTIFFWFKNTDDWNFKPWHDAVNNISFTQAIAFQGFIQLFFIVMMSLTLLIKDRAKLLMTIFTLSAANVVVAAQLNIPVTVTYNLKTSVVAKEVKEKAIADFPVPEVRPVVLNNDSGGWVSPFWRNLNLFKKQPAWDGYNSFQLKNYVRFVDDESLRQRQITNNWIYFADTVIAYLEEPIIVAPASVHNVCYVPASEKYLLNIQPTAGNTVSVKTFIPGKIIVEAKAETSSALTLMQQHYHGWKIYDNGKEVTPVVTDYLFMTIPVAQGSHRIEYRYENKPIHYALWLSGVTLITLIGFSLFAFFSKNKLQTLPR